MPCVDDTLAPRFIAEIGDIRRFKNKHSVFAFTGIDALPFQYGTFNASERHISKCGKKAMIAGPNKFLRIYYGKVMELNPTS